MQIQVSTDVISPMSVVFSYLTDIDKLLQWQTFLVDAEQLSDGAIGVGSKFRNVLSHPGFDTSGVVSLELIGTVLVFEPDQHLRIKAESNIMNLTVDYQLHQVDTVTTLQQTADFELLGFLLRPVASIISGFLRDQFLVDLQNLKSIVEKDQQST